MTDTTDRPDEVRRWKCTSYCLCGSRKGHFEAHDEGAWVLYTDALAEIDRLRAEVSRLTQEDAAARSDIEMLIKSRDVFLQEVEELRAEIERLTHPAGAPADDTML